MIRLFGWIRRQFRDMKLKNKLFLTYAVLILLPLGVYTSYSYMQISTVIRTQTEVLADQIFDEALNRIENKARAAVQLLDFMSSDRLINEIALKEMDERDYAAQSQNYSRLRNYVISLENNNDLLRIRLYFHNDALFTLEKFNFFSVDDIREEDWYRRLQQGQMTTLWFRPRADERRTDTTSPPLIAVARYIWNPNDLVQKTGIARVDMPEQALRDILEASVVTEQSAIYLVNSEGQHIAGASPFPEQAAFASRTGLDTLPIGQWSMVSYNGTDYLIRHQQVARTDWTLVSSMPITDIMSPIDSKRNQLFLVMFAVATFAYLLAYSTANFSTKRISQLIRRMQRVQTGDFNTIMNNDSRDEIGDLVQNFNFMMQKFVQLNREQFESGKSLKQAELRILQAQINPHFLYNSLDVINCVAIDRQMPDVSSMVVALTRFYKLGLSNGKEIVTLREELEHCAAYVDIQNIRFNDAFTFDIAVPDELMRVPILKITLQPLVENAILHGILEKPEPRGVITVSGERHDHDWLLHISDDGVGMTPETAEQVLGLTDAERGGFGIRNIQDRIKLTCNESYGLSIRSAVGKGTTVTVRLPLSISLPNTDNEIRGEYER